MAKSSDWLPRMRELRLAMAKNWLSVLQTEAQTWNIPATAVQELAAKTTEAENMLAKDLSAERTKTITAQCKAAFDVLDEFMRDFKRRYFLLPPLEDADLISLERLSRDGIKIMQQGSRAALPPSFSYMGGVAKWTNI